jgi:replication factor C subunit 2/4
MSFNSSSSWLEKYKPLEIKDIYGNEKIISRLKNMIDNNILCNLIISGPSGVGKSCSIKCLLKLYLKDSIEESLLELNGSDDRGINIIRILIKSFAQRKINEKEMYGKNKIIFLDEADSITTGSQQALRRIIEKYSNSTRFIFICNNLNKIIEPIQSRCVMLKFEKLDEIYLTNMILKICIHENITYTKQSIKLITEISDGDMRQTISNLQNTFYSSNIINKKSVYNICNIPLKYLMKDFIHLCLNKKMKELYLLIKMNYDNGYSVDDLINTIFYLITNSVDLSDIKKIKYVKEVSIAGININNGVSELIPIYHMLSKLCVI